MNARAGRALQESDQLRDAVLAALAENDAERVQPPLLHPADDILVHYGEEIRARACVLPDAHGGELFLAPDYTVPVCRMHLERGGGAGRYVYAGPVFRMPAPGRGEGEAPVEEAQAGIEIYDGTRAELDDAEVLRRSVGALKKAGVEAVEIVIGEAGLGDAILATAAMPDQRRERLRRRIGQPARFHELLQRFIGAQAGTLPPEREALLERFAGAEEPGELVAEVLEERGIPHFGQRTLADIGSRLAALAAERYEAPLDVEDARRVEDLLALRRPFPQALAWLKEREEASVPGMARVIESLVRRAEAIAQAGIDPERLLLDARFVGELGYYDGFVFAIRANGVPVAGGGRYDSLPRTLGGEFSAVGAAIWIGRLAGPAVGEAAP